MVLKVFLVTYMLIDMIPPQRWHASITTKTQKLACSGDFFEQLKSGHKQNQKLEPKIPPQFFSLDFLGNPKKPKKLQKCNFATLQLFHVVVFFNCFLIKKGKKVQKLQSCILQLFEVFFGLKKKPTKKKITKKMEFQSEKFGFQEPSPYFFGDAFISKICI